MASRTRDKLIEAARQLFIRKGVEDTTISDIANASDKGRRTIYTYFKDKWEIYRAVVERESERMVARLREVSESEGTPTDKLRRFIELRMSVAREQAQQGRTLLKSLDFGRADKIRRLAIAKEKEILRQILDQGITDGTFDAERCQLLDDFATTVMNIIDYGLSADQSFDATGRTERSCIEFIIQGITAQQLKIEN